jgi:EpsI family protein
MTTSRLAIVFAILLSGLSSVFILPKQLGFMPVGINLELPESLGEWWGIKAQVTQHEKDVLGPGTDFSRMEYSNGRGDRIQASIVLAGEDMMTSIHRPERCLAAQGWEFAPGDVRMMEIPGKGKLPVMRLVNRKLEKTPDGKQRAVQNICYYWFAGFRDVTDSHFHRVRIDTTDRLSGGYVQRWAMMMMSSNITAGLDKFGRDEKATDEVLSTFIQKLAPEIHKDTIRYR